MQEMDSTIIKTPKRSLTDSQEKFLDVLFGEAKGNLKKAGELAGYSEHSYPKVVRNLKQEILSRAENYLATHSAKAATKMVDMLDEDGTTPHANIRLEAAKQILDRIGITLSVAWIMIPVKPNPPTVRSNTLAESCGEID